MAAIIVGAGVVGVTVGTDVDGVAVGVVVGAAVGCVGVVVGVVEGVIVAALYKPSAIQDKWQSLSTPQVAEGLQQSELEVHPHLRPGYGPLLVGKHSSVTMTVFSLWIRGYRGYRRKRGEEGRRGGMESRGV